MSTANCENCVSSSTSSYVNSRVNIDMDPLLEVIVQDLADNVKDVLLTWDATSPDKAISLNDLKHNIGVVKPMPPVYNGANQITLRWCPWSVAIYKIQSHNVNINIFKDSGGQEKIWYQTEVNTMAEDIENLEVLHGSIVENYADEPEKQILYQPTVENHADETEKEIFYQPIVENHADETEKEIFYQPIVENHADETEEEILYEPIASNHTFDQVKLSNEQQTSTNLFSTSVLNVIDMFSHAQVHNASSFISQLDLVKRFCSHIQLICEQYSNSCVPLSAIKDWWEDDNSEKFPEIRHTFSWEFILQILKDNGFQTIHENGLPELFYDKNAGVQSETNLNSESEIVDLTVSSTSMNNAQNSQSDVIVTEPFVAVNSIPESHKENSDVTPNETDCSLEIDTSFNYVVPTEKSILSRETNEKESDLRRILKRKNSVKDNPGGLKKRVKFCTPISSVRTFFKNSLIDSEKTFYRCDKCTLTYKGKSSLNRHYKKSHGASGPE